MDQFQWENYLNVDGLCWGLNLGGNGKSQLQVVHFRAIKLSKLIIDLLIFTVLCMTLCLLLFFFNKSLVVVHLFTD